MIAESFPKLDFGREINSNRRTMQRVPKPSWKQCALLIILLSHTAFGSPIVTPPLSSHLTLSFNSQAYNVAENNPHTSLDAEDVFSLSLQSRSERKKRSFSDEIKKKIKQAKLLTIGAASAKVAKSAGKSILKAALALGIKALILNLLFATKLKLKKIENALPPLTYDGYSNVNSQFTPLAIPGQLPTHVDILPQIQPGANQQFVLAYGP